ncbi:MAG TPA: hypothetical protein VMR50_20175 [Myxococcota bacterium]|nr:hypothetical protein [Myxococcota bacterium]
MASRRPLTVFVSAWIGFLACGPRPAEFRVIGLDEARRAVVQDGMLIVEAHDAADEPPDARAGVLPDRGVLIVGLDARAARVEAATFARAGNHPVLVFIPRDADERGRFYAAASQRQEVRRGKDS